MNQKIIVYYWRCICSSVDRAVASGAACGGSIPLRRIFLLPFFGLSLDKSSPIPYSDYIYFNISSIICQSVISS